MTSGKTPQPDWLQAAEQFQNQLIQQWTQAAQAFPGAAQGSPTSPDPFAAFKAFMPQAGVAHPFGMPMPQMGQLPGMGDLLAQTTGHQVRFDPAKLIEIQNQYLKDVAGLWNQGPTVQPKGDRRFADESWGNNPVASYTAAVYLLNARTLMALADAVEGDAKTRTRVRFAVQQWIDASAPSNFLAFNAEAQKKAIETQGESIAKGVANLLHDIKQGHVSMTDESVFEVGKNVATTEGAVVFENELFQLIEYKPLTAKVYERPFLLVPPCINKFYILDLQPTNSFIRYCVEQGNRTFVVSWRNPDDASLADKTWDDYIEDAVIKAITTTQDITGAEQINALGFCVGGTMLSNALAVSGRARPGGAGAQRHLPDHAGGLHGHGHPGRVHRRAVRQDARDAVCPGWADAGPRPGHHVQLPATERPGLELRGRQLPQGRVAAAVRFAVLELRRDQPARPVLRLVPAQHVPGEQPRQARQDHGLRAEGGLPQGQAAGLHLRLARGPHRSDRWRLCQHPGVPRQEALRHGCFGSHRRCDQPARRRQTQPLDRTGWPVPGRPVNEWIDGATEHKGSWWTDWAAWLKPLAGKQIAAPKTYGRGKAYAAIEPAPGRYVKAKA